MRASPLPLRAPKQSGFTLVEIMIAAGIVGVLISVAVPMFTRYQSKSRQAEAKISLSAIYSLEKSFYSEYSAYIPFVDAIGFQPEAQYTYYNSGFANGMAAWSGSITGFTATTSVLNWESTVTSTAFKAPCPGMCMPGSEPCSLNSMPARCPNQTAFPFNQVDPQQFSACAGGQILTSDTDRKCDYWQVTESKKLTNFQSGL